MKLTKKVRLFIKNLPEKATSEDIQTKFADYGNVIDVKVQERKNLSSISSHSRYFAYVNIEIDDYSLTKCFKDFASDVWYEQNIELQIAKENFLEVLKREREESAKKVDKLPDTEQNDIQTKTKDKTQRISKKIDKINACSASNVADASVNRKTDAGCGKIQSDSNESSPKNERASIQNGLTAQSEIKRVQSVNQMLQEYHQQKMAIKTALSDVDFRPNNKIIFDEQIDGSESNESNSNDIHSLEEKSGKKHIFESDDESDDNFNFEVKKTFEGKKGKELFELQSRYKNDKRFVLDERFIDDEGNDTHIENITTEEEKQRQYKILEEVLGRAVKQKESNRKSLQKGGMLRFDPTHSEHEKYEITKEKPSTRVEKDQDDVKKTEESEGEQLIVSKDQFYNVRDDLKETFEKQQEFSLLNLFGNSTNTEDLKENEEHVKPIKTNVNFITEPFKYDSSDGEETEAVQNMEIEDTPHEAEKKSERNSSRFWSETFFFRDDDYRLQEGFDFMKRVASENKSEFTQVRKKLKEIVKTKVRHNQRKNRPFKKKLSGNKRKKIIRMKKALKR